MDSSEDQPKTYTLLYIDFEPLSNVHVYRIEYVSYRKGTHRIRIDTAADRIVPALLYDDHPDYTTIWKKIWIEADRRRSGSKSSIFAVDGLYYDNTTS